MKNYTEIPEVNSNIKNGKNTQIKHKHSGNRKSNR